MSDPWFRKWMGFSYVPIRWQGSAVLLAMVGGFVPPAAGFLVWFDDHPVWAWISAGIATAVAIVGHAIVVWKLERDYSR